MKMRFLFRGLTLVLLMAFGEAVGDRLRWSRRDMVEMAGYGELKLSSVLLTASLLSSSDDPIPGVTVGIKCHTGFRRRRSKWIKAVTNELGQVVIDLPSHLHAIPYLDKACSIRPLSVPKPYHQCFPKIHRGIKFVSSSNGSRVYTAGNITLHRSPCT
uniref:Pollen Ole e 1 allergen and extensin family protein n=1 Tax=Noccaea caerulescens TaxID=107243 RepID=A0A1J3DW24_NOCCA